MRPSRPTVYVPGSGDDNMSPTHDAISAWLLRAASYRPRGGHQPCGAEHLLSLARPELEFHDRKFQQVELEALLCDEQSHIRGIADALLHFSGGERLWIEIKSDDRAIGALVRQVKMYKRLIVGDSKNWLAILPRASDDTKQLLAHAGIGVLDLSIRSAFLPAFTAPDTSAFASIPKAAHA